MRLLLARRETLGAPDSAGQMDDPPINRPMPVSGGLLKQIFIPVLVIVIAMGMIAGISSYAHKPAGLVAFAQDR
jgi:hypothetical protein